VSGKAGFADIRGEHSHRSDLRQQRSEPLSGPRRLDPSLKAGLPPTEPALLGPDFVLLSFLSERFRPFFPVSSGTVTTYPPP
jgi:hypothetical protein